MFINPWIFLIIQLKIECLKTWRFELIKAEHLNIYVIKIDGLFEHFYSNLWAKSFEQFDK
jgi:hypothetical protein